MGHWLCWGNDPQLPGSPQGVGERDLEHLMGVLLSPELSVWSQEGPAQAVLWLATALL